MSSYAPKDCNPKKPQYFLLSGSYFDPAFRGHLPNAARILLKDMSIHSFFRQVKGVRHDWLGEFSHRRLVEISTLHREAVDRQLKNLLKASLIRVKRLGAWGGDGRLGQKKRNKGTLWEISRALRAEGDGLRLATEPYRLGMLKEFSVCELFFLEWVTFIAYTSRKRSLAVELGIDETAKATGLSTGTVKRARRLWTERGLLVPTGRPRSETKDNFLLNPALTAMPQEHFKDFSQAQAFWSGYLSDQKRAASPESLDQKRAAFGSFPGRIEIGLGSAPDQKRANIYFVNKSLLDGAQRHISSNKTEGGEEACQSREGERMSPFGHDQTPEKGGVVVLTAAEQKNYNRESLAIYKATLLNEFSPENQNEYRRQIAELNARFGKPTFFLEPSKNTIRNSVGSGEEQQPCPA